MKMKPVKATDKRGNPTNPLASLIPTPTQASKERLALYFMKQLGYNQSKANKAAGL